MSEKTLRAPVVQLAGSLLLCALYVLCPSAASASALRVDQKVYTAMKLDQNARRGAKIYAQNCASCHGKKALGNVREGVPALAGQRKAYLVKALADFSELERDSRDMHRVVARPALADPQTWADVASHLNALPPLAAPQTGEGKDLQLGEAIFREQCASCHEQDARGDDDGFVPSLRNQHYAYLLRQMQRLAEWHRLNVDSELVRFIGSLEEVERSALADYLSRLRGPTRDRSRLNEDGTVSD